MPQPTLPPIPSRISSAGVGQGRTFVGSGRSRYGEQEDPMDQKLRRLAEIEGIDREGQASDLQRNAAMMNMAKEMYGIRSEQQLTPAHVALMKAQSDYYGQRGEDLPEERQARAMQLELGGLGKAYYGREQTPEYQQGVKNVLTKYGYNTEAPATATPAKAGEFGGGTATPTPTPSTSKFASLGHALSEDYTGARNAIGVPAYNAVAGLFGATPAQPRPMASNVPADYNFWLPQLRKQQQVQPQTAPSSIADLTR